VKEGGTVCPGGILVTFIWQCGGWLFYIGYIYRAFSFLHWLLGLIEGWYIGSTLALAPTFLLFVLSFA
jgi:hypothetical protein